MAGLDDNFTVFEDWTPNPSPRTFLSNFLNEEFGTRSFSDILTENGSEALTQESDQKKTVLESNEASSGGGIQFSGDLSFKIHPFNVQKSSSRGGLTERIAARAGFNAPKLNTTRISPANMISPPSENCSPYLTIPHGLSPTTLLESPVFLSNSMAQPSPTTGKIPFGQNYNTNSDMALDGSKDQTHDDMSSESFAFKPHPESSPMYFSSAENKGLSAIDHHQQLPNKSVQSEHPTQAASLESDPVNFENQQEFNLPAGFSNSSERKDCDDITLNQRVSDSFMCNKQSPPLDDRPDGVADPKGESSAIATGAPAEDGYNWRKYGQKQVKGSEFPRSYYKCTQPNCLVKKKVERSHEGHITEIIYKGAHNHPKPPPNRRSAVCHPFNDPQYEGSEHPGSQADFDGKHPPANTQNGIAGQDWRDDGLEATSSASGAAEFCDPSISMQIQDVPLFESSDTVDVSSTLSSDEFEDDRATHGSVSLGGDVERDETESKRRKLDACTVEMSPASRAVRESRVVVQTTSEVDILDDGYRWRKYGQKVVKGNPNPRSYYKCTSPGCMVRKHVERASHDLKSVITTYEGKHNHDVPAARNSNNSHAGSLGSGTVSPAVSQAHSLHRRSDSPAQDLMMFNGRAPSGAFGPAIGVGFGMPQQGFGITGLSTMASMKMRDLPPVYSFINGHQRAAGAGLMMPKGELKEEPLQESGMPMSNSASVYCQMTGRLPLGPQL